MKREAFIAEAIRLPLADLIHAGARSAVYGARRGDVRLAVKAGAAAHAESDVLAEAAHPRIAPCLFVGSLDDGAPAYVAPRYVSDLDAKIRKDGPLAPAEAVPILCDIAAGLAHLHDIGLRHGDCAPANVLLTEDGRAVLGDLEFAAPLDAAAAGAAPGIFPYLAPEARDGLKLDARADIYGLGAIGWAMLTGLAPTPFAPAPPAPAGLIAFVDACLAPDRRARPADGVAAAARLDGLGDR